MRIKIGQRLRPFSHLPGVYCLLPGTCYRLQLFPTRLFVDDISEAFPKRVKELKFDRKGPVPDFTVLQDIERAEVACFGHAQDGYFHTLEKGNLVQGVERLSLGSHKKLDLALMQRRIDFKEIFPIWFQLGQMLPVLEDKQFAGTLALLGACQEAIISNHPETILASFEKVYRAGFEGIFSPRLQDEQYQGIDVGPISSDNGSPLWLLKRGAELIRSLFVSQVDNVIHLLPALPPQFHSGRLLGVKLKGIGTLDLEWSKKEVRRCIIHCEQAGELFLSLKHFKSFRINKGGIHLTEKPLSFTPGELFLERFRRDEGRSVPPSSG